jgi:hypothetical protein
MDIGNHDVVLGMSWHNKHNPEINWKKQTLSFTSTYCNKNCLIYPNIIEIHSLEGLPSEYKEYTDIFSEEKANQLPPNREGFDLSIDLIPNSKLKHGPIYNLNPEQAEECKKTFQETSRHRSHSNIQISHRITSSLRETQIREMENVRRLQVP